MSIHVLIYAESVSFKSMHSEFPVVWFLFTFVILVHKATSVFLYTWNSPHIRRLFSFCIHIFSFRLEILSCTIISWDHAYDFKGRQFNFLMCCLSVLIKAMDSLWLEAPEDMKYIPIIVIPIFLMLYTTEQMLLDFLPMHLVTGKKHVWKMNSSECASCMLFEDAVPGIQWANAKILSSAHFVPQRNQNYKPKIMHTERHWST